MTIDRRKVILNSAAEVFGKFGFHGATMEDIAREAEIGKGTIYGYFDSKEILFYEMIKYGIEEYEKGMERALEIGGSLEEKLMSLCKFHKEYLNRYLDITQIVMSEKEALSMELMAEIMREKTRLFNKMKEVIKEKIDKGELREDLDEEIVAIIIIGSINHFYGQKLCYEKVNQDEIQPDELINTILKGLE